MNITELLKAHENNFDSFIFYDLEVFQEDSIAVFKDINGRTLRIFHNDFHGLKEFIDGKVLVGYNNYHYDDYVLAAMIDSVDLEYGQQWIKVVNDNIISSNTYLTSIPDNLFSLDCFQQINVAKSSLKKIEANIGLSIDETAVDFNINRKLTNKELADTINYCGQDVNATITIFKLRWFSYFISKLMIVDMLDEKIKYKALRWNTTTITAYLLVGNNNVIQWDAWQLGESNFDNATLLQKVPKEVREMWRDEKEKKYTHYGLGAIIEFSKGGLHGTNDSSQKEFKNVKLLDVTSLYPNILIKLGALGKATKKYQDIVNKRIQVKHSDTTLSNALKLVINATYGLMKNQYSKLYNPNAALSVCIYGQIALYDLCERLYSAGYTLININTDGVAFNGGEESDYMTIQKEWESEYGLELELSEFDYWYQKDVNNYVAVDRNNHIKVKGGEVNHYFDPTDYLDDPLHLKAGVNWTSTNTKGIINKCIVDKLVHGRDFVDTCVENRDHPILFQYVLQAGNTYLGTIDEYGNEYQKVNRVFATNSDLGVTLKKVKLMENKDGEMVESQQYFPNAPENMFVYNGDLRDFDNFKDIIDIDFYVNLAEEKYNKLWK